MLSPLESDRAMLLIPGRCGYASPGEGQTRSKTIVPGAVGLDANELSVGILTPGRLETYQGVPLGMLPPER
jgi:hypothetical protein